MSSRTPNIETASIHTRPGIELSQEQKTLVGNVLGLFAGRPSLEKLQLWPDEAVFEDPLTIARGRKQYGAQWAFSKIERLHYEVTSTGNPISMELKTRYKVKGIAIEKTIDSTINIYTSSDGKIDKVEDKWDALWRVRLGD